MSGDQTSSVRLVGTLGLISLIAGVLIAFTFKLTEKPIAANQSKIMEEAVFQVLPGAAKRRDILLEDAGPRDCKPGEKPDLYAAEDASGAFIGYAIRASGRGYAGNVDILYGYSPEKKTVIGMKVLQSNETPGLGDKILKDPGFIANFTALDVSDVVKNPIETVKHGKKTNPWQIDGISGSTVSSKAVGKALRESTTKMVPRLQTPPPKKEVP